jgi:hypothetical protein
MFGEKGMIENLTDKEVIEQLKARILELETTMDELARSSFNVIKYFVEKKS